MLILLAASVLYQGTPPQPQKLDLIWRPTVGQKLAYDLSVDMALNKDPILFSTHLELQVLKVEKDGAYDLLSGTRGSKNRIGQKWITSQDGPPHVEHSSATGVRSVPAGAGDNPLSSVFGPVTDFSVPAAPVSVGGKWTRDAVADPNAGSPASHSEYELKPLEHTKGGDVYRITYNYREVGPDLPVSASGYFLLSAKDFSIAACDAKILNVTLDPDFPRTTVAIKMQRLGAF